MGQSLLRAGEQKPGHCMGFSSPLPLLRGQQAASSDVGQAGLRSAASQGAWLSGSLGSSSCTGQIAGDGSFSVLAGG